METYTVELYAVSIPPVRAGHQHITITLGFFLPCSKSSTHLWRLIKIKT